MENIVYKDFYVDMNCKSEVEVVCYKFLIRGG